jgi:hypothetical protein
MDQQHLERGNRLRINNDDEDSSVEGNVKKIMSEHPANLKVQYLNKSIKTKISTFLSDNDLSLVIELRNDTKGVDNEEEAAAAIGLATYSNSESTVLSNASIFETLWLSQSSPR